MKGRHPKPIAQKKAEGNPGGRSLEPVVPPAPTGAMRIPRHVAKDRRARSYWDWLLRAVHPLHFAMVDAPAIARLCQAWALIDRASERLERARYSLAGRGRPKKNAADVAGWYRILRDETVTAQKLAGDLMITVVARNRTGLGGGGWRAPSPEAAPSADPTAGYFDDRAAD